MTEEIEEIYLEHQKKFVDTVEEIKQLQAYYDKCQQAIGTLMENAQSTMEDFSLCLFYEQKHPVLQDIVKDNELN